jgi:Flp pilus assembly protein TadD
MAFTEGRVLYRVRRYRDAEGAYKRAITLDPGFPNPYSALALLYTTERRFADARDMMQRRDRLPSARVDRFPLALLEAASGNRARALELAKAGGPNLRARLHLVFGEYDAAFTALAEAIDTRTFNVAQWTDPDFDVVRSDPRFARAVERMGIAPAPLVAWGQWPDRQ